MICDRYLSPVADSGVFDIKIVSGKCKKGADVIGEAYASERGYPVEPYPASWYTHGMAAGPVRNEEMAKICTGAIIFWDGKSRGSKNMLDMCEKHNKPYKLVMYEENRVVKVWWRKGIRKEEEAFLLSQ